MNERRALLRSVVGTRALKGPFVSAPSLPAPVVEGLLPVREQTKSMKSSGRSW
jgi:hypothetical protein